MFGIISEPDGERTTVGDISWTVAPEEGEPVNVHAEAADFDDQISYVLAVPFESVMYGWAASSNTLQLTAQPAQYNRSEVYIDGIATDIVMPAMHNFLFSQTDRGTFERVDLAILPEPVAALLVLSALLWLLRRNNFVTCK